jgi:hypothetical protein
MVTIGLDSQLDELAARLGRFPKLAHQCGRELCARFPEKYELFTIVHERERRSSQTADCGRAHVNQLF